MFDRLRPEQSPALRRARRLALLRLAGLYYGVLLLAHALWAAGVVALGRAPWQRAANVFVGRAVQALLAVALLAWLAALTGALDPYLDRVGARRRRAG